MASPWSSARPGRCVPRRRFVGVQHVESPCSGGLSSGTSRHAGRWGAARGAPQRPDSVATRRRPSLTGVVKPGANRTGLSSSCSLPRGAPRRCLGEHLRLATGGSGSRRDSAAVVPSPRVRAHCGPGVRGCGCGVCAMVPLLWCVGDQLERLSNKIRNGAGSSGSSSGSGSSTFQFKNHVTSNSLQMHSCSEVSCRAVDFRQH